MRWAGGFLSALLTLLFLLTAFLYGANYYLRGGGEQIGDIIRRYAPGAEVRFSRAGLRLGWGTAAFYAEDLFIEDEGGGRIAAPQAEFWLGTHGIVAVLYEPDIILRRNAAAPLVGEWAVEARRATVHLQDANGISLTLHNALLRARHFNGRLQASIHETQGEGELRLAADVFIDANGAHGTAEVALKNWPPGPSPPHWKMIDATVRADFDGDGAQLSAAGKLSTLAVEWRADGYWDGAAASLTIAAAANEWQPLPAAAAVDIHLRGGLQYQNGAWELRGGIIAAGADGKADGDIHLRGEGAKLTQTDADLRMIEVPATSLWKYVAHPETREWLAESSTGGTITAARLRARGVPPQTNIELTAAFAGGRIRVGERWPDAHHLNGVLFLREDGEVIVHGEGEIAGAAAHAVRAHIPAVDAETPVTLYLRAAFDRAPLQTYLAAARAIPPARGEVKSVMRRLGFDGDARLSLAMQVPLADAENAGFGARLTILGNGVITAATESLPPLSAIFGEAFINNGGVRAELHGQLADAAATVFVKNEEIQIYGTVPATLALSVAGITTFTADGAAKFTLQTDAQQTVFISDLHGISFALPPPLHKAATETASLRAESADGQAQVSLHLRDNIFHLHTGGGVDIAINEPPLTPPATGIYAHGEMRGNFDPAAWLTHGGGEDNVALSLVLADTEILNMSRQTLTIHAPPPDVDGMRQIALHGEAISGTVFYRPGTARAELSHLRLAGLPGGDATPDIIGLSIAAAVEDFSIGEVALGALTLHGAPAGDEWILNTLGLANGENTLGASGRYDGVLTALTLQLATPDAVAALEIFGQTNIISEGGATLAGGVFWPGAPTDFSLGAMEGQISLLAEDLRYLKSEHGVISLLAVFSPQSLLQLGFTELGKEGVQLKTMHGEIGLRDGVAEFKDIVMENDELNISLQGNTDLRTKILNISGRVRPGHRLLKAGSAVGIGVVVAVQPLSLAAGWFLGKVFEKPLSEIGAYNYTVTGVWSDPIYAENGANVETPQTRRGAQ